MSAPSKAEILEEFVGEIEAVPDDVFDVWFENNASDPLKDRIHQLTELANTGKATNEGGDVLGPYESRTAIVLDLLSDVVDVWLDAYKG